MISIRHAFFAVAYPDAQIVKQLVSLFPWGHVIRLLQRITHPYLFDCLCDADPRREREVEQGSL